MPVILVLMEDVGLVTKILIVIQELHAQAEVGAELVLLGRKKVLSQYIMVLLNVSLPKIPQKLELFI